MSKKRKPKSNAKRKPNKKEPEKNIRKDNRKGRGGNARKISKGNSKGKSRAQLVAKPSKVDKKVTNTNRKGTNSIRRANPKNKPVKRSKGKLPQDVNKGKARLPKKPVELSFTKVRKKNAAGRPTRFYDNVFQIDLPGRDLQEKRNALNRWNGKELNFYINRYRLFPRAFMVILRTKKGKNTFEKASKMSPPKMAVTPENIKLLIAEAINDLQENFYDVIEEIGEPTSSDWVFDPSRVTAIFVRFFYAPELLKK